MKKDYSIEDDCIRNKGTERQKEKEKRDLSRQRESMGHRCATHTDQQRQAILQRKRALICVHVNYKLSIKLHAGTLLLRLAP